ncbi:Pyridoxal phosphate-dependent transferase, major domain protein [Cordyceps fumosorosea ARSEF 2679]|uniref:Pyridoxal phosphate-dependent transferase, major domain protein n=1 Tax=Cordyceps fumosorosea (strain ARSEF 2679) TaxID=1081104 RepID=A0A168DBB0_CORFA|nr:Pyridoxal phosphate-dependent transferase, major domain protein [Cordyceps fumosorosea ARSEF 2679]OAA72391.1 Pyridoxal phosphate-dependent transferase, major domain protein [Cordyceps fumosorosea ARSEF 2679]
MADFYPEARKRFPALQSTDQVFLDNAGGSQTLDTVIDSIRDYLCHQNVQLGATYAAGRRATATHARALADAAAFLQGATDDEVVFGASATQLLRTLSWTLRFRPGDEVVVSAIDHEANVAPWVDLAERQGLELRWWRPRDALDPELHALDLAPLLTPRTRLVCCTHASNVLGTVTDVRAVADLAHGVGALLCVDGVTFAPHRLVDVRALGVDFYVFSWYKVYGPHLATLYASWAAQTRMRSLGHLFNAHTTLADKMGLAAGSYELCHGVSAVVSYLGGREYGSWSAMEEHEEALTETLLAYLRQVPGITIYGKRVMQESRLPIVSFTVDGWSSQELVEAIEARSNYGLRWGAFYSNRLVRETLMLKKDGVVRVSLAHYNTMEEVLGLIKVLKEVLSLSSE